MISAKPSVSSGARTGTRKGQKLNNVRYRTDSHWKKTATMLSRCLILIILLGLSASTPFKNQNPAISSAPFEPVGDVAVVTAPGFDTCVAPPASLLKTWWRFSPYQWLNVYLGGVSMFPMCGGKELTPEWARTVYEQGWSFLLTWVGPQAPCAKQHAVMSSDSTISYAQGLAEADAAISAADRFGFSHTAPIYFDMEYFSPTMRNGSRDDSCIQAVKAFLKGWNNELTMHNHFAGFYASASNYPLLTSSISTASVVAWIAGGGSWTKAYDRTCTVYGNAYLSDNDWSDHQRIYQYTGGHDETYGQQTWNIDSDCADAPMVGHITTISLALQPHYP